MITEWTNKDIEKGSPQYSKGNSYPNWYMHHDKQKALVELTSLHIPWHLVGTYNLVFM